MYVVGGGYEVTNSALLTGGGEVRVELLNESGYRIRGYSRDDAVPVTGDSLRHQVSWNGRDLRELPQGRYMLRLHLNQSTAYALSMHCDTEMPTNAVQAVPQEND